MVLISPASPAAHLLCPIIDLTEPSAHDCGDPPASRNNCPIALGLGLVADDGAGAVRFDQPDPRRRDAGLGVGPVQRPQLPLGTRGGQPLVAAVARCPDPLDDRVNAVAVALGVGQSLEDGDPDTLGEHDAVGGGVERAAAALRAQGVRLAERDVGVGRLDRVAAHHDGHVAGAVVQLADAGVERGQRRPARGVDRHVRAAEVEAVRDPSGGDVQQDAGERVLGPLGQDPLAQVDDLSAT